MVFQQCRMNKRNRCISGFCGIQRNSVCVCVCVHVSSLQRYLNDNTVCYLYAFLSEEHNVCVVGWCNCMCSEEAPDKQLFTVERTYIMYLICGNHSSIYT